MGSIQEFIIAIMTFINNVLIPFIFGLALLFFVWNAFRFFILGSEDKDAKDKARNLALYSVAGFVFLVSIWGIVNLLVNGLGWNSDSYVNPDYILEGDRQINSDWWRECGRWNENNRGRTDCN
jgi:predicted PurR-regulated permease PerM